MSEPLISIDDMLEWEGCCFGDLMSDMLSDNMKDSSTAEDCLTDFLAHLPGLWASLQLKTFSVLPFNPFFQSMSTTCHILCHLLDTAVVETQI
jgi:hypothetical protein